MVDDRYITGPGELGVHQPSVKREFLRSAAQGDLQVHRTCLRSVFGTALWKRLWVEKDKEW
jgi:hypothetical protein